MRQAYRRERGHLVFFDRKHENCENQEGRDEHFDEHSLGRIDPLLQVSAATRPTVNAAHKSGEEDTHL